ncbi:Uncharacterised protein [Vibrio cholerae]|nr:Uncharacterised protein [Vibrio cholerae]
MLTITDSRENLAYSLSRKEKYLLSNFSQIWRRVTIAES